MTEEWLQQNALWIIMDPWYPHPYIYDNVFNPNINEDINGVVEKIISYIPNVKHVVTCMNSIANNKQIEMHSKLQHFYNIYNKIQYTVLYLKKHNLQNIVYCGFHHGRCIINNNMGAKQMSKHYKIWVKKDLCGFMRCSRLPSIDSADKLTAQYATII